LNPTWIEPPPPQRSDGCFGRGCAIFAAFVALLGLAFVGGTFVAVRVLRSSYFSKESSQLPASSATADDREAALEKWQAFERAARKKTASSIELTADEINALIASEKKLRGKAFVTIDRDTAHLQVSVSLGDLALLHGRYMNAECTVQSAEDGSPSGARITNLIVNGKPVGEEVLSWHGPWGFRRYLEQWIDDEEVNTFEVKDGKVILTTHSSSE
jgi:hypothetical protein